MKKKFLFGFMLASLLTFNLGCNPKTENTAQATEQSQSAYYPVTVKTHDFNANEIEQTYEKAPERVVAVYQSSIENLLALGLGDKIVYAGGLDVEIKDEWKEEYAKVKETGDALGKEAVLSKEPDFIASWKSYFGDKMIGNVDFWQSRNVNSYIMLNSGLINPNTLENEYADILTLGKIFNKEDKAKEIVASMEKQIEDAKEYAKDKEKVNTVILEVSKNNQYRNYGDDSIGGQIATMVGAELVIPKNGQFTVEELIAKNPQVIFTVYYGEAILKDEAVKVIKNNPALANIDAVKNDRVYAIMLSEVYASGVRTADGIRSIVKGLYPEYND